MDTITIGHNKYVIHAKFTENNKLNLRINMLDNITSKELNDLIFDLVDTRDLLKQNEG